LENNSILNENTVFAYVYLKNKIFINAYLIKAKLALADREKEYKLKRKFLELERKVQHG
jgi:endonuclease YncB( thermonuclease family)